MVVIKKWLKWLTWSVCVSFIFGRTKKKHGADFLKEDNLSWDTSKRYTVSLESNPTCCIVQIEILSSRCDRYNATWKTALFWHDLSDSIVFLLVILFFLTLWYLALGRVDSGLDMAVHLHSKCLRLEIENCWSPIWNPRKPLLGYPYDTWECFITEW